MLAKERRITLMPRVLPNWCKRAKKKMIDLDMSVPELANKVSMTREYTSAIINGRAYSQSAIKSISDVLNISDAD
jgi:DNA-binding helix-turn-helix protein